MPGPKCSPKVAAAADQMVKKPNLTAKDAMHLAGFSPYECECRKLQKRVNQKKLRVLKASKELVMVPKEKKQSNVSMKKIRLLKAFSKLQLHIPKLDFPNPLLGYKTMVRYT